MLEQVGLSASCMSRRPHELSGGPAPARVYCFGIDCAAPAGDCCEPVSALDVTIQAQILQLLADLRQRMN